MYKKGKHFVYAALFAVAFMGTTFAVTPESHAKADTQTSEGTESVASDEDSEYATIKTTTQSAETATTENQADNSAAANVADTTDAAATTSETTKSDATTADSAQAESTLKTDKTTSPADTDEEEHTSDENIVTSASNDAVQDSEVTTEESTNPEVTNETNPDVTTPDVNVTNGVEAAEADEPTTLESASSAVLPISTRSAANIYSFARVAAQSLEAAPEAITPTFTMSIDQTSIGYGNTNGDLVISYGFAGNAGDTFSFTIPADSPAFTHGDIAAMTTGLGTMSTTKNADGSITIVYALTTGGSFKNTLSLKQMTNGSTVNSGIPMTEVGTTTKTISYQINNEAANTLTFTQTITPTANPSDPSRLYPSSNAVNELLPNVEYVYSFSVNETDGVLDDADPTKQVNAAANYGGTVITIPVPAGFTLDSSRTNSLNAIASGSLTQITQPDGAGGNIIITVAAGGGTNPGVSDEPYKLAGYYDLNQTADAQTVTASGAATISQVLNAKNDTLTKTTSGVWTDTIAGTNDTINSTATVIAGGNGSTKPNQIVINTNDVDDPLYLNSFSFTTSSAQELTNAKITITIPDGFNATGIMVPSEGATPSAYLPGTTSYAYTITLADGSVENGTVKAGETLTPAKDSAIREVVLTPNYLAPGAETAQITAVTVDPGKTLEAKQRIFVMGTVSSTYDDGSLITDGTVLTTDIEIAGDDFKASDSFDQTVLFPEDTISNAAYWVYQTKLNAGATDAGWMSQAAIGLGGQSTDYVYEPVFYYVIPSSTNVNSVKLGSQTGGVISYFTADDGRTVVKVDYSGTGLYVNTNTTTRLGIEISLNNNADALPGTYPLEAYVYSPVTQLLSTDKVKDTSFTDGQADAVAMGNSGTWTITAVSTAYNVPLAQGNTDVAAVLAGTSKRNGDTTLHFYDSIVNTSSSAVANATAVINLPTIGDSFGSEYTFELAGGLSLPTEFTTATGTLSMDGITATVLYSTNLKQMTAGLSETDKTGYVTADQVTDWSKIRSIIIQYSSIPANASTGRISIDGTTTQGFLDKVDEVGYLQTAFVGEGYTSVVLGKENSASILLTNGELAFTLSNTKIDYDGITKASGASDLVATVTLADGTTQDVKLSKDDFTVVNDGTDVNDYSYSLTDQGVTTVENAVNYDINSAGVTGVISIVAVATSAALSKVEFAYDGKKKASDASGLAAVVTVGNGKGDEGTDTINVPLTNTDYTFITDGVDADTYKYKLTDDGLKKVQAAIGANYLLAAEDVENGTVTIVDLTTAVTLNDVKMSYDGTTKASGAKGLTATATVTTADGTSKVVDLTSADIEVTNDSAAKGEYTYKLSSTGIKAVQAAVGENYTISNPDVTGKITITPASATISLSGVESQPYNGAQQAPHADGNYTVTLPGGASYALKDEDIQLTSGGKDKGTYGVELSETGKKHIEEVLGGNYNLSYDTDATFTITQKSTAGDVDENVKTNDETITQGDPTPDFSISYGEDLSHDADATLTNDDFIFTTIDKNGNVVVIDGVPTADGIYSVNLNASGQQKVKDANPNFKFDASSFVPGTYIIKVNGDAGESQNNIVQTDNKTITEGDPTPTFTVTYGDNLNPATDLTIADFIFTTIKDGKTIVFNGIAPTEPGVYSVNLNALGQAKVKAANQHEVFSANAFKPGKFTILTRDTSNPSTPVDPGTPGDNGTGTTTPEEPGTPETPETPEVTEPGTPTPGENPEDGTTTPGNADPEQSGEEEATTVGTREAYRSAQSGQSQEKLPQTDESSDKAAAVAGISLMGMLLGLLGAKRKKREDN